MKKHLKKRFLSMLLALVLTLGVMPVNAYATEANSSVLPFDVTVGGVEVTEITESEVTWTNWDGNELTLACYTVTVPHGSTESTLKFEEEMQWTYYTSAGEYIGEGATSWTSSTEHTVAIQDSNGDTELDGISVQDPATYSTAYYILFVYAASQEPACLNVMDDAPTTGKVSAGGLYKLNLNTVFADTEEHSVEYSYTISPNVENEHTKIMGEEFCFTSQDMGDYQVMLKAKCADGKTAEHALVVTVKEASEGLPIQYGYDETNKSSVTVYVTFSNDGMPLAAADGTILSNLEVTVPYFDLSLYGLQQYYRFGTENGKGTYINNSVIERPTGLHLYIYLLERYYMGLPEEACCIGTSGVLEYAGQQDILYMTGNLAYKSDGKQALKTSGGATSIYMNNFWGHDENLMYFRNHCYPYMNPAWGSTSDYILLSDGDSWDVAMFSDWSFNNYGYFASFDQDVYTMENGGSQLTVSTRKWGTSAEVTDFEALNGSENMSVALYNSNWEKLQSLAYTDQSSNTISLMVPEEEGVYYLLAMDPNTTKINAKAAPAAARIVVGKTQNSGDNAAAVSRILLNSYNETILVGDFKQLTASVLPAEVTDWIIQWSSSDEAVASVDQNGNVTAVGEGTAEIIAAIGEIKAVCVVTVEKYNSAPTVVSGSSTWAKIKTNVSHTVDVAALFTDAENDTLTYTVTLCEAAAVGNAYDYTYNELKKLTVTGGKCTVSLPDTGIYLLKMTASDGKLSATHNYQLTVVNNDAGLISLNEDVSMSVYNVVVVESSEEFVKDFDMGYGKGIHDTTLHHIVLSKDTLSHERMGKSHYKLFFTMKNGAVWGQQSGSGSGDVNWQTRADIGIFAKDSTGVETAHYLQFHVECQTHTDTDKNSICDKCTMQLPSAGQFALMAVNSEGFVIDPSYISYAEGATVKDALKNSGHVFEGIDSGFISAIDGKVDNYSLHYNGEGYSLDMAAADVTALWFTTNSSQSYSDDLVNLVAQMTKYNTATNGVKDYAAAQEAYANAAEDFIQTSNAKALFENLKAAMDAFDAFVGGQTISLNMNITQGSSKLTTGLAVFTSEFGTTYSFTDFSKVDLIPATYSFDVSDGTYRHVRGSITVAADSILKATVPDGTWIKSLDVGTASGNNWQAVEKSEATESSATFHILDSQGTSIYPYAVPAEGLDTSACKLYYRGYSYNRTWESKSATVATMYTGLQKNSMEGFSGVFEAVMADGEYEQYQTFVCNVVRVPTLSSLTVMGEGAALKMAFDPLINTYDLTTTSDAVEVSAAALCDGVEIKIAGNSGTSVSVPVSEENSSVHVVLIGENGQKRTYTLKITKQSAVEVTIAYDADTAVELINPMGSVVAPNSRSNGTLVFELIPDETYTWVTTKNTYYHATGSFTAKSGLSIVAATPKTEDWGTNIAARTSSTAESELTPDSTFDAADHTYTFELESNTSALRILAASIHATNYPATICYTSHNNTSYSAVGGDNGPKDYEVAASNTSYKSLTNAVAVGGWGNKLCIEYKQKAVENGVTFYQEYFVDVVRSMTLNTLSAKDNKGNAMVLTPKNTDEGKFVKTVYDYTAAIASGAEYMELTFKPLSTYKYDSEYTVIVTCGQWKETLIYSNLLAPNTDQTIRVPLNGTADDESVTVTVAHKDQSSIAGVYTIVMEKLPPANTTFVTTPADTVIFLTEDSSGARILPEDDGSYILNTNASYTYVITRSGYIAQTATFIASETNKNITLTLVEAPDTELRDISQAGDWLQFRADENNNGVIDYKTPIKAEDAVLDWANKIGEGYSSGATGCPIIVGGYLYTYAGNSIVKVNKETGEVVNSGCMAASSSFAINSPTYADGMLFVGLSGGRVQAFNAETLESLWLYADSVGSQPNCPIVYCDGYIYTGFWSSETAQASYVCLAVTDEDPTQTTEKKLATWTYRHNGFYWAGAYASEDFVLMGTDDGEGGYTSGYASILSLDAKTGVLLDEKKLPNVGDQRSSICYDQTTDAYYFTTKGGDFYQVKVKEDGTFVENSLRRLHLDNGTNNPDTPPMSTSTPVIYNGRAYIGVSGSGQFGAYSGHNMTVIDLETFSIAYTVPTKGYPQTSGLLTTAYEDRDGYVYVYFIDNYTPGMIRVLRDQKGMTEVDHSYTSTETYTSSGQTISIETGYVLFTPHGDEGQYAICSPIADNEGNLYFKNDSAKMMRLSNRITKLEIVEQPEKLVYETGMTFDSTGLKVIAHYANGISKDISQYLGYTTELLTADDTEITVSFAVDKQFEKEDTADSGYWQWYQDVNGTAGQTYYLPTATINVEIREDHTWDEGTQTIDPDCTNEGEITYVCTVCGEIKKDTIEPNGHSMSKTEAKAATCTEAGNVEYYTCDVCNKNFADEAGENVLSDVVISKTGHQMGEFVVTKEPTETEVGEEVSQCENCDYKETREIPVKVNAEIKVEIAEGGITTVPDTLKDVGLDTTEKVKESLIQTIITQNEKIAEADIIHYDVTLMYSDDGGNTWIKADKTHWPESGKLTIVMPYPEGTDSTYTFTVIHMFTSTAFGKIPGNVEMPEVINTEEGIKFEVTGLSPISVGWTKEESSGEEPTPTPGVDPTPTPAPTPTPTPTPAPAGPTPSVPAQTMAPTSEASTPTPVVPATSDSTPIFGFAMLTLLSSLMLVVLLIFKKKSRELNL